MERLKLFFIAEIILLISMLIEQYKIKYKNICLTISGSFLIFLISIRKNTPDLKIYEIVYYYPERYEVEKGHIFLQNIFKILKIDFRYFIVFIAFITIILLYKGFNSLTNFPNSAMFIYMAYSFLEKPYIQIRNALSIAIFLNVLPLIIKKEKLKSLLGILISVFFHITSYFYFFVEVFIFFNINFNKKKIKKLFLFTLILSIAIYFINIIPLLIKISYLNLGRISERIQIYFLSTNSKEYIGSIKLGIRGLFSPIIYIFYYIKIMYLERYFYNNIQKEKFVFFLLSFSVLFRILSYKIEIFTRMVGAFDFSETLALVLILELKNKYIKFIYIIFIIVYVFLSNYVSGKKLNLW